MHVFRHNSELKHNQYVYAVSTTYNGNRRNAHDKTQLSQLKRSDQNVCAQRPTEPRIQPETAQHQATKSGTINANMYGPLMQNEMRHYRQESTI